MRILADSLNWIAGMRVGRLATIVSDEKLCLDPITSHMHCYCEVCDLHPTSMRTFVAQDILRLSYIALKAGRDYTGPIRLTN